MDNVPRPLKTLRWIGSSYDDFMEFRNGCTMPWATRSIACRKARHRFIPRFSRGRKAEPSNLSMTMMETPTGAVYTVRFAEVVYILHAFKKKSKKGIATPKPDMDLIRQRLRLAEEHYKANPPKER